MQGKVCLVTGATSGIGLATASGLAKRGATVVLAARNPTRAESALAQIRAETDNDSVGFLLADLSVQAQVRKLAKDYLDRYPRLDVLVNNAGAFFHRRQESMDGIEMTWALNLLAPFLLTRLLLPRLTSSAPARIINVSSFMHRVARIDFGDVECARGYIRTKAYSRSKLALVLLTYEFARRLNGDGVTANALDPGFVATNIISGNSGWSWKLFQHLANLVAVTPQHGAATILYLATSPDLVNITGRYFRKADSVLSSPASYDQEAGRCLWQTCLEMTRYTDQ
jgi:NAD(P)-dependent dehydrogenase (short-subunit alcohol dehydrogenase family)